MSVDPSQLRSSPHTGYYLTFFVMKTPLIMNGQPAQITSDDGHLTLSCRNPPVSITFDSLIGEVDAVVKTYGLEVVSNYWCEEVPLFELKLSSQRSLKRFLRLQDQLQSELASRISANLTQKQQSVGPIVVYAHCEVHMLTPRPETKDAKVLVVTSENIDTCATIWRESEVFNFGALYRAMRIDRKAIPNEGTNIWLSSPPPPPPPPPPHTHTHTHTHTHMHKPPNYHFGCTILPVCYNKVMRVCNASNIGTHT